MNGAALGQRRCPGAGPRLLRYDASALRLSLLARCSGRADSDRDQGGRDSADSTTASCVESGSIREYQESRSGMGVSGSLISGSQAPLCTQGTSGASGISGIRIRDGGTSIRFSLISLMDSTQATGTVLSTDSEHFRGWAKGATEGQAHLADASAPGQWRAGSRELPSRARGEARAWKSAVLRRVATVTGRGCPPVGKPAPGRKPPGVTVGR
jgi:hypothetical protein